MVNKTNYMRYAHLPDNSDFLLVRPFIHSSFCLDLNTIYLLARPFIHSSYQGWEFAHLLRSLKSNEQLWAICSNRSGQMSNCEQIAQVAHVKRATISKSLRSLMKNEQSWDIRSGRSFAHKKWAIPDWLNSYFLVRFLYVKKTRAIRSFPHF